MTLEQLAAQLLWCGWGQEPEADPAGYNEHARFLVEELQVGGLVLFDRNLRSPAEIAALTGTLRSRAAVPPLIGIDQEGGRVARLPLPGLTFPGNMALGAIDDPERTRAVYRTIGEQLAALGIDVDFAPDLDVNNNPDNPIIGVRSFGEDPEKVARHGVAAMEGLRDAGVLPVIKHFPGHGDTDADSHLELPVQRADRERLDRVELVPFRAALAAGAPAVMTTHILFPALAPDLPATLSPRIVNGLLRSELGFDGLVVTDCMEMRGIAAHWGPEEAAVLAIEAGVDMLLVCHTQETQVRMHRALCEAVRTGRLTEERLRQSLARIEKVRALVAPVAQRAPEPERVSAPAYREMEEEAAADSLYLWDERQPAREVYVAAPILPFTVTGTPGPAELFAAALEEAGANVVRVPFAPENFDRLRRAEALVVVAQPNDPFPGGGPSDSFYRLLDEAERVLVVAAGEPYLFRYYPQGVLKLAAWGARPLNMRAAARWLAGKFSEE